VEPETHQMLARWPRAHRRHARRAQWFTRAGFQDVRIKRIGPKWYRGVRRHGLIMGCSVTGVKTQAGARPRSARRAHAWQQAHRRPARGRQGSAGRRASPPVGAARFPVAAARALGGAPGAALGFTGRAARRAGRPAAAPQALRRACGAPSRRLTWHAARAARQAGDSPLQLGPKLEASGKSSGNPLAFLGRFVLGTLAGGYFFLLPIYMWLKNLVWPRGLPGF